MSPTIPDDNARNGTLKCHIPASKTKHTKAMVVIVTKTITNCSEIFSLASCCRYSYLRGSSLLSDKLLMPYIMLGLLCLVLLWFIGPSAFIPTSSPPL